MALWIDNTPAATFTLSLIKMAAFNLAAIIWTAYLLSPEPERKMVPAVAKADHWNFVLASALHPTTSGPALPLIESAVERIFEKTSGKNNGNGNGNGARPPAAPAAD
jgi:hypothetical protein